MRVKIKNWDLYQATTPRKDKGKERPPDKWRKLYASFFSDFHVRKLTEADRFKLQGLYSIANLYTGIIDMDDEEVCHMIGCKSIDISKFGQFVTDLAPDWHRTGTDSAPDSHRDGTLEDDKLEYARFNFRKLEPDTDNVLTDDRSNLEYLTNKMLGDTQ